MNFVLTFLTFVYIKKLPVGKILNNMSIRKIEAV